MKILGHIAPAYDIELEYDPANVAITGGTISGVVITDAPFATATNPATNAATTIAIVNANNGVLISLTNTSNSQTLGAPTVTTAGKRFTVINNDTSTAGFNVPVVANGVTFTITPGEAQTFIWDGTAWGPIDLGITSLPVPAIQGGTGKSLYVVGDILYADSTTTLAARAAVVAGSVLSSAGSGTAPTWNPNPVVTSITGNLVLPETGKITLSPALTTTDHTAQGEVVTMTAGETTVLGYQYYLKSDGRMWQADASVASTMPGKVLCLVNGITAGNTTTFLKRGYYRDDSLFAGLTVGGDLYTSETSGLLTQTAPVPSSTATVQIQPVGHVPSTNTATVGIIWYDPQQILTEAGVDVVDVAATTGTELVDFTPTGWNEDASTWTMAATGPLVHVTGNTTTVTATLGAAIVAGNIYKVVIDGTGGGGTATYTLGGTAGTTTIAASGTIAITDYVTATTTGSFIITPASACTVSLTGISIRVAKKVLWADLTAVPLTYLANHTSNQTFFFDAPTAADVGKRFIISKTGTGAGTIIIDAPTGVTIVGSGGATAAGGTLTLATAAYGSVQLRVNSATVLQLEFCDGAITYT